MPDTPSFRASIALAAYSEPLVDGRRAVVFGDSSSQLAEHLLERGARLVHVYDMEPTRVAEAAARNTSRNISYAPLGERGAAVRDGAFDLAIVENLAAASDPAALVKRVHRALSPRGAALVASANPDMRVQLLPELEQSRQSIDYYALYDAVALEFEQVRMLGQTPFVGYAIVDFAADGEPAPALDAGFVPGGAEEPEWFIALASTEPVELDDFAVVQLPFLAAVGAGKSRKLEDQLRAARRAERHARERMAELESDNERLRTAERTQKPQRDHAGELDKIQKELEQRDAWIAQLEARAATADARADESLAELEQERASAKQAARELESARRRAEQAATEARTLRDQAEKSATRLEEAEARAGAPAEELEALQKQLAAQRATVEQAEQQRDRAREELSKREAQLAELTDAEPTDLGAEVGQLEAQLLERGRELLGRERELREAERIGRELLHELENLQAGPGESPGATVGAEAAKAAGEPSGREAELARKLDSLARLNAQREADLETARWSIAELEGRLADGGPDTGERAELESNLQRTRAEVQKLAALVAQLRANAGSGEAEVR